MNIIPKTAIWRFCRPMAFRRHRNSILGVEGRSLHHDRNVAADGKHRDPRGFNDLTKEDMSTFFHDIRQVLCTEINILDRMCQYYFDGSGKSIRPKIVFLTAYACNKSADGLQPRHVSENQRKVAMIAEMIHTGSLIHDDVVDVSSTRRGRHTVNKVWGERNAVLSGNYVLSRASYLLASIGETEIVKFISTIIEDLVKGEFMQLNPSASFDHYLKKTYQKTASLIANSCKSAAYLSGCDHNIIEDMYQYGRNVGIAFQLIDDLLDFSQSAQQLGKPAAADLKLGLATAPVLFACEKHPFLHDLIMRRFNKPGDVERALEAVHDSDGLEGTRLLAQQYSMDARRHLQRLVDSEEKAALASIADLIVKRTK